MEEGQAVARVSYSRNGSWMEGRKHRGRAHHKSNSVKEREHVDFAPGFDCTSRLPEPEFRGLTAWQSTEDWGQPKGAGLPASSHSDSESSWGSPEAPVANRRGRQNDTFPPHVNNSIERGFSSASDGQQRKGKPPLASTKSPLRQPWTTRAQDDGSHPPLSASSCHSQGFSAMMSTAMTHGGPSSLPGRSNREAWPNVPRQRSMASRGLRKASSHRERSEDYRASHVVVPTPGGPGCWPDEVPGSSVSKQPPTKPPGSRRMLRTSSAPCERPQGAKAKSRPARDRASERASSQNCWPPGAAAFNNAPCGSVGTVTISSTCQNPLPVTWNGEPRGGGSSAPFLVTPNGTIDSSCAQAFLPHCNCGHHSCVSQTELRPRRRSRFQAVGSYRCEDRGCYYDDDVDSGVAHVAQVRLHAQVMLGHSVCVTAPLVAPWNNSPFNASFNASSSTSRRPAVDGNRSFRRQRSAQERGISQTHTQLDVRSASRGRARRDVSSSSSDEEVAVPTSATWARQPGSANRGGAAYWADPLLSTHSADMPAMRGFSGPVFVMRSHQGQAAAAVAPRGHSLQEQDYVSRRDWADWSAPQDDSGLKCSRHKEASSGSGHHFNAVDTGRPAAKPVLSGRPPMAPPGRPKSASSERRRNRNGASQANGDDVTDPSLAEWGPNSSPSTFGSDGTFSFTSPSTVPAVASTTSTVRSCEDDCCFHCGGRMGPLSSTVPGRTSLGSPIDAGFGSLGSTPTHDRDSAKAGGVGLSRFGQSAAKHDSWPPPGMGSLGTGGLPSKLCQGCLGLLDGSAAARVGVNFSYDSSPAQQVGKLGSRQGMCGCSARGGEEAEEAEDAQQGGSFMDDDDDEGSLSVEERALSRGRWVQGHGKNEHWDTDEEEAEGERQGGREHCVSPEGGRGDSSDLGRQADEDGGNKRQVDTITSTNDELAAKTPVSVQCPGCSEQNSGCHMDTARAHDAGIDSHELCIAMSAKGAICLEHCGLFGGAAGQVDPGVTALHAEPSPGVKSHGSGAAEAVMSPQNEADQGPLDTVAAAEPAAAAAAAAPAASDTPPASALTPPAASEAVPAMDVMISASQQQEPAAAQTGKCADVEGQAPVSAVGSVSPWPEDVGLVHSGKSKHHRGFLKAGWGKLFGKAKGPVVVHELVPHSRATVFSTASMDSCHVPPAGQALNQGSQEATSKRDLRRRVTFAEFPDIAEEREADVEADGIKGAAASQGVNIQGATVSSVDAAAENSGGSAVEGGGVMELTGAAAVSLGPRSKHVRQRSTAEWWLRKVVLRENSYGLDDLEASSKGRDQAVAPGDLTLPAAGAPQSPIRMTRSGSQGASSEKLRSVAYQHSSSLRVPVAQSGVVASLRIRPPACVYPTAVISPTTPAAPLGSIFAGAESELTHANLPGISEGSLLEECAESSKVLGSQGLVETPNSGGLPVQESSLSSAPDGQAPVLSGVECNGAVSADAGKQGSTDFAPHVALHARQGTGIPELDTGVQKASGQLANLHKRSKSHGAASWRHLHEEEVEKGAAKSVKKGGLLRALFRRGKAL